MCEAIWIQLFMVPPSPASTLHPPPSIRGSSGLVSASVHVFGRQTSSYRRYRNANNHSRANGATIRALTAELTPAVLTVFDYLKNFSNC